MKYDHINFMANAYTDTAIVADRVRRFTPMVRKAAWHISGMARDGLELEDLISAGFIALTECAQRHDGPSEDGFAAYAKIRVRGAMFDLIRKNSPESRTAIRRRRQMAEASDKLSMELGRPPNDEEIGAYLKLDSAQVRQAAMSEVRITPLEGSYDEHSLSFADEAPDAFSMLVELEDRDQLIRALEELPDRLKLILQLHFVEELNLTEIAQVLEISVPRVHQLKAQALHKLHKALGSEMEFNSG